MHTTEEILVRFKEFVDETIEEHFPRLEKPIGAVKKLERYTDKKKRLPQMIILFESKLKSLMSDAEKLSSQEIELIKIEGTRIIRSSYL